MEKNYKSNFLDFLIHNDITLLVEGFDREAESKAKVAAWRKLQDNPPTPEESRKSACSYFDKNPINKFTQDLYLSCI